MMKWCGILPLAILFIFPDTYAQKTNDLQDMGIKGSVSSIIQIHFLMDTLTRDTIGRQTSAIVYEFNFSGYLECEGLYVENRKPSYENRYVYDKNNNRIQSFYWNEMEFIQFHVMLFDSLNNPIVDYTYDKDSALVTFYQFQFDGAGNLILDKIRNADGSLRAIHAYTYDHLGNRISCVRFGPDSVPFNSHQFIYDTEGNKIEENFFEKGVYTQRKIFRYDDNGNCIEEWSNMLSDERNQHSIHSYDDHHNMIESTRYLPYGEVEFQGRYVYLYDDRGNWIQRDQYINQKFIRREKRLITYY